ncbi:MAG: hypothetical protein ACOVNV_06590, partial [Pirellulaceae bacterium]
MSHFARQPIPSDDRLAIALAIAEDMMTKRAIGRMRHCKQPMDVTVPGCQVEEADFAEWIGGQEYGAIAAGPLVYGVRDGQIAPARAAASATQQAVGV